MSFLDVLESIGTGQRAAAPQAQPSSYSHSKPSLLSSNPTTARLNDGVRAQALNDTPCVANGTKSQPENKNNTVLEASLKPSSKKGPYPGTTEKKVSSRVSLQAASRSAHSRLSAPPASAGPTKTPTPGSYAALMANAKAAQEQRAKSEVGLIKHQATSKERLSQTEKRKREVEEIAMKTKLGKQAQHNSKVQKKSHSNGKIRPESSYKGTAKPATPVSSYRGTAGLPSQHRPSSANARYKSGKKGSRLDDYLATDEEDEGDESDLAMVDDGYGSDASSDMEADAFAVEEEENKALQQARADDAKEMALENRLKREKEERRRKLEALAKKRTLK